jgi:hypothetical protein
VALSSNGTVLAVGGTNIGTDLDNVPLSQVHINEWDGIDWQQVSSDLDGTSVGDSVYFSAAILANGAIVADEVPRNNANGFGAGRVQVFWRIESEWK